VEGEKSALALAAAVGRLEFGWRSTRGVWPWLGLGFLEIDQQCIVITVAEENALLSILLTTSSVLRVRSGFSSRNKAVSR